MNDTLCTDLHLPEPIVEDEEPDNSLAPWSIGVIVGLSVIMVFSLLVVCTLCIVCFVVFRTQLRKKTPKSFARDTTNDNIKQSAAS